MNWRSILGGASRAAPVTDDEADDIARARLAAITGRTSGRVVAFAPPVAAVEPPVEAVAAEPEVATAAEDQTGAEDPLEAASDDVVDPAADADVAAAAADALIATDVEVAADADPSDVPVLAPAPLDGEPGFPWTARFIALWTREVADSCPAELGDAIRHWQRWADQQDAGAPLIEEAGEEFRAMIATWRDEKGAVPGLSAADAAMRQIVGEAADDARLAELLPEGLRPVAA